MEIVEEKVAELVKELLEILRANDLLIGMLGDFMTELSDQSVRSQTCLGILTRLATQAGQGPSS